MKSLFANHKKWKERGISAIMIAVYFTGRLTGYDFIIDHGQSVQNELENNGLIASTLISDFWQANALQTAWLDQPHGVQAINAYFSHLGNIP